MFQQDQYNAKTLTTTAMTTTTTTTTATITTATITTAAATTTSSTTTTPTTPTTPTPLPRQFYAFQHQVKVSAQHSTHVRTGRYWKKMQTLEKKYLRFPSRLITAKKIIRPFKKISPQPCFRICFHNSTERSRSDESP